MQVGGKFAALVLMLAGSGLAAQSFNDQITQNLESLGFSEIEIVTGAARTRVEASRGSERINVVYDRKTGAIIRQKITQVPGEGTGPGLLATLLGTGGEGNTGKPADDDDDDDRDDDDDDQDDDDDDDSGQNGGDDDDDGDDSDDD